ncbi:MAG TPA: glycosyltransferase family 2 protein [Anaerolineae bacterium]|nr:glycosyltransferase family 2 protein [Anaerolineae bacterium]
MIERIELSVVIPVYNSAKIFPALYRRLVETLSNIVQSYEIIAVVDGCTDNSAEVIEMHTKENPHLKMVELSRNFGHQMAITAGLQVSSGEMVVVMDDDLEDQPELLPKFISKAQEGYDVVYGIREKRKVSIYRRVAFRFFYRLLNRLSAIDMPYDSGDFCLMKRPIVDALNAMPETNRYIRGLRTWLGLKQVGIEYERGRRPAGRSGYRLINYIKLAMDGILSFSYKPLTYVSVIGFVVASASFLVGMRLLVLKLIGETIIIAGWASIMVAVLFIGGVQLISIGILGQYIARIYDEVKQRPKFIIKRTIGLEKEDAND